MNSELQPFNTPIEYGFRALIILQNIYPKHCDIDYLSCLDYLVVHSGDFDSSIKSIHAPTPNRNSEIYIRRGLIEKGVQLFSLYCLIKPIFLSDGVHYKVTEECEPFLDLLSEDYISLVKGRAAWAIEQYGNIDTNLLRKMIRESMELVGSLKDPKTKFFKEN